jgi:hypothetical protein
VAAVAGLPTPVLRSAPITLEEVSMAFFDRPPDDELGPEARLRPALDVASVAQAGEVDGIRLELAGLHVVVGDR